MQKMKGIKRGHNEYKQVVKPCEINQFPPQNEINSPIERLNDHFYSDLKNYF